MNTILHINSKPVTLEKVEKRAHEVRFELNGQSYSFRAHGLEDGTSILEEELAPGVWQRVSGGMWSNGKNGSTVQLGALEARISETRPDAAASATETALSPLTPMPGLVRQLLVKKGDIVKHGQALAVLEAMKLQLTLSAGGDATVDKVLATVGQMVSEGVELVKLIAKKN